MKRHDNPENRRSAQGKDRVPGNRGDALTGKAGEGAAGTLTRLTRKGH